MEFKKKQWILGFFLVLLLSVQFFPARKAQADVETDIKKFPNITVPFFTIKLVPPENQPEGTNINFYKLRVQPGMTQQLEMYITSTAKKKQKISLVPTNGSNSGGSIIASGVNFPIDPSNQYPFTKLGIKNTVISLEPGETKNVKISYKLPDQSIDGVIIGGLHFSTNLTKESDGGTTPDKKSKIRFENNYTVAVQVVMTENDKPVLADMKVKTIMPLSYKTAPAVSVNIQNPKQQYIDGLSVDATIVRLANSKDVHSQKVQDYKVAPTSNFNYVVPWRSNEKMEPGKYRLDLKAKAAQTHLNLSDEQKKKQEWNISKEFTITKAQADDINRKNPNYKPDYTWLYIIIAVLAVIFVVFLFWLVFTLGRKRTNPNIQSKK